MARKVNVPGAGQAKVVNPWIAFFLALLTLGIYYIFWFGIRNSELNDYGESFRGDIVPPFISQWRYYRRIARAQELAGMEHRISHVTGFLLYLVALFLLPFEIPYAQHHLNRLWEHVEAEREKGRVGMRGSAAAVGV